MRLVELAVGPRWNCSSRSLVYGIVEIWKVRVGHEINSPQQSGLQGFRYDRCESVILGRVY